MGLGSRDWQVADLVPEAQSSDCQTRVLCVLFSPPTASTEAQSQEELLFQKQLCAPLSTAFYSVFCFVFNFMQILKNISKMQKQNERVTQCVTPEQGSLAERLL